MKIIIGKEIIKAMKKVTLLGDSIRLVGYGLEVSKLLGDEYKVFQPEDNCRFVKYTLRMLFEYKDQIDGSDIIHWNNGLWDTSTGLFGDSKSFTNKEEYVENMLRVANELKRLGKRIIFATTTPVHFEYPYNDNEVIKQYNAAIVPELQKMGIEINDLHSLVAQDIDKYISEDKIHLSQEGIELCSKQVVKVIKSK